MFQVTTDHIGKLNDKQLVALLRILLHNEALNYGLPLSGSHVPAQINVADGGEDGRIEWENSVERTHYLPRKFTIFQVKATDMTTGKCRQEVKAKKPRKEKDCTDKLNEAIQEVISKNGAYIIFCKHPYVGLSLDQRKESIREGIQNCTTDNIENIVYDFYDANKIAEWVNIYPAAIFWVLHEVAGVQTCAIRTWDSWSKDSDFLDYTFVEYAEFSGYKASLNSLLNESKKVARIVGHSGLGKSRTALELFRVTDNPSNPAVNYRIIYLNASENSTQPAEIANWLLQQRLSSVLIVDDCPLSLHKILSTYARNQDSCFTLLTLDYDMEPYSDGVSRIIELSPYPDEVIEKILNQSYPDLNKDDKSRIVHFAQGYPLMAVLLGRARLGGEHDCGALNDSVIESRMLSGRSELTPVAEKVIYACSLFDYLGIEGDKTYQREFVAEKICNIDKDAFYAEIKNFKRKQVIQQRGDYIQVRPKPLAVRLAARQWERFSPEIVKSIFYENLPDGMTQQICDQLAKLDFAEEPRKIAADLCAATGPFGNAEVLNTEQGSRCFRSLVEVNPEAASEAVYRAFYSKTYEELLEVGPGRRNLVWALEKLCCRKNTYPFAARVLFKFASAENESWGNNATGIFKRLFNIHLSGTEVPPELRFPILDEAIKENDDRTLEVVVKALNAAIETNHFSRTAGAETQGSAYTLIEWRPSTYGEKWDYFKEALKRLTSLALRTDKIGEIAKTAIAPQIRGLIRNNLIEDVHVSVAQILQKHGSFWPEALASVTQVFTFDSKEMPTDYLDKVSLLKKLLIPEDLNKRIKLFVSEPPYGMYEDDNVRGSNEIASNRAKNLANEVITTNKLFDILPNLLVGEQRLMGAFTDGIIENIKERKKLIQEVIKAIKQLPCENRNYSLLGYLMRAESLENRGSVNALLDQIANDTSLCSALALLTTYIKIEPEDINRISLALSLGKIKPENVRVLAYGKSLDHLPTTSLRVLLQSLFDLDLGGGIWPAIFIVQMYCLGRDVKFQELDDIIFQILFAYQIFSEERIEQFDIHSIEPLVIKYLEIGKKNDALAIKLGQDIVTMCQGEDFPYDLKHFLNELIPILLEKFPEFIWPLFSDVIIKNDPSEIFYLQTAIGERFDKGEGAMLPIFLIGEDNLKKWCLDYPTKAPAFLLEIIPLVKKQPDGSNQWTNIVQFIIDEFGENKQILHALSSNMGSYSVSGSLIPYYEQYLAPLATLAHHRIHIVREWSLKKIKEFKSTIEYETKREEERDLGIF
jgi:hypothetical protein